jgi:hypothetical protein
MGNMLRRRPMARALVAGAMTVTALVGLSSAPASADTPALFRNKGTGMCLHHNGSGVVQLVTSCSLTNGALKWHVHDAPETQGDPEDRRIVSSNGGLCLFEDENAAVVARTCQPNLVNELWDLEGTAANGYRIRNHSGRCMGTPSNSSGRVNTVDCSATDTNPLRRWLRLT